MRTSILLTYPKFCDLVPLIEIIKILTRKFAQNTYKTPAHKDFFEEISDPRPNTSAGPGMAKIVNSTNSTWN